MEPKFEQGFRVIGKYLSQIYKQKLHKIFLYIHVEKDCPKEEDRFSPILEKSAFEILDGSSGT